MQLREQHRSPLSVVRQVAAVLLGMNGIVPGRMTPLRYAAILGSFAFYYVVLAPRTGQAWGLGYFVAATVLHYGYLFGMFRPRGWSRWLRRRYDDERGYLAHEGWMAFVFCHNALSIGFICYATRGVPLLGFALPAPPPLPLAALAGVLVLAGLVTKVWATLEVGLDAYYYRDLFLELVGGTLRHGGPYRLLRNPMYTVGHLQAYGVALAAGSAWGLAAVIVNQALVLLFNATIEQPHVTRTAGPAPPRAARRTSARPRRR